jgi:hypothetical protein
MRDHWELEGVFVIIVIICVSVTLRRPSLMTVLEPGTFRKIAHLGSCELHCLLFAIV